MKIVLEKQPDGRNFILLDGVPTAIAFTDQLIIDLNAFHDVVVKDEMKRVFEQELRTCGDVRLTAEVIDAIIELVMKKVDECLS